jgi:hypothetical protein
MPLGKTFLSYPGCRACLAKPCDRLRFGRVFPGKFLFVHKRRCGAAAWECPFVAGSFSEVRQLAEVAILPDLIGLVDDIASQLAVEEHLACPQQSFVASYPDIEGRFRYLEALWYHGSLTVVRVPQDFLAHEKLAAWLLAKETIAGSSRKTVA